MLAAKTKDIENIEEHDGTNWHHSPPRRAPTYDVCSPMTTTNHKYHRHHRHHHYHSYVQIIDVRSSPILAADIHYKTCINLRLVF